jgi:hypothetical protein
MKKLMLAAGISLLLSSQTINAQTTTHKVKKVDILSKKLASTFPDTVKLGTLVVKIDLISKENTVQQEVDTLHSLVRENPNYLISDAERDQILKSPIVLKFFKSERNLFGYTQILTGNLSFGILIETWGSIQGGGEDWQELAGYVPQTKKENKNYYGAFFFRKVL